MVKNVAKLRQPLVPHWLWPGILAATLIVGIALVAFAALWFYVPAIGSPQRWFSELINDSYLWQIVRFTFWQAFLSVLLSLIPAVPLALALYRRRFIGRSSFLRLCAMTLVLPVLVAVFGLLTIYGQQGWLARLCGWLSIDYQFSIYGLQGILLAHVFFNLPLATRLVLQSLNNIAVEQRQLAAQLGMNKWQLFRFVELPAIWRQLLPTGALIFMLCFASFATVLSLGGGPRATTIELAIYQALRYDFDLQRAVLLALIQLVCCLSIMLISQRLSSSFPVGNTYGQAWRDPQDNRWLRLFDGLIIAGAMLLLLPPIAAIMVDGLNGSLISVLTHATVWQAIATSLQIALTAGLLCLLLSMMLLWSSRELRLRRQIRYGEWLELSGMTILAMPAIVLATGFFLLLINTIGLPSSPMLLIIIINALMAIPYCLKVLSEPMLDLAERYNPLSQSLGIVGWNRLRWVELAALKRPLAQALAFACVLSLGDFSIIALFGSQDFMTLPFYLYQQLGSYRSDNGAVAALLLLLVCFILFTLIERLPNRRGATNESRK